MHRMNMSWTLRFLSLIFAGTLFFGIGAYDAKASEHHGHTASHLSSVSFDLIFGHRRLHYPYYHRRRHHGAGHHGNASSPRRHHYGARGYPSHHGRYAHRGHRGYNRHSRYRAGSPYHGGHRGYYYGPVFRY